MLEQLLVANKPPLWLEPMKSNLFKLREYSDGEMTACFLPYYDFRQLLLRE